MQLRVFFIVFLVGAGLRAQFDRGSIDFGLGGIISVGLQEEIGFDARVQHTTLTDRYKYLFTYHRYFVQETNNSEVLNELGIHFLIRILAQAPFRIDAGVGYVVNDYPVLRNARDTSDFYVSTGRHNHALQLKCSGHYRLNTPMRLFLELNIKSFGKRYDTVVLGLTYSMGI